MLSAAAGSIIAAGISSAAGLMSARNTNKTNVGLANTNYQRSVADMKAAGINPILAAGGGSGASSARVSIANPGSEMLKQGHALLSSANEMRKTQTQRNLVDSTVKKQDQEVENAQETNNLIKAQVEKTQADTLWSLNNARSVQIENDAKDSQKNLVGKGWELMEQLYNSFGEPLLNYLKNNQGNKTTSSQSNSENIPTNSSNVVLSDEWPHLWDKDYDARVKQYKYIQSVLKNKGK